MQIFSLKNHPNFKQIQLSQEEYQKGNLQLQKILNKPYDQNLDYEMFKFFEAHLNKEVDLKQYKTNKERQYFSTKFYIKFFDILKTIKYFDPSFDNFIKYLNDYSNKFILKYSPAKEDIKPANYNISTADETAKKFLDYLNIPRDAFVKMATNSPFFSYLNELDLKNKTEHLIKTYGFSKEECINIYMQNPQVIFHKNEWLNNNIKKNISLLKIDNPVLFKETLKVCPELMTYEKLEDSIKNIAKFLELDEERTIKIIEKRPGLATTKIEHLKNNFYSMKNYLDVDWEKMRDYVEMAPVIMHLSVENNIQKYNAVCDKLGIDPTYLHKKAKLLPSIYRITSNNLEKYIDFVSNLLSYTREEAIEYLGKNLNVLSYKAGDNLKNKCSTNFELLNKELGIDYDQFIELIKENAWIIGHKKDDIKQNLSDIKDYFNIDTETLTKLATANPQILTTETKYIENDLSNCAEWLNIDKEDYKKLCLIEPILITRSPKFHKLDIPYMSRVLNISMEEFIKFGKINPKLLIENAYYVRDLKDRVEFSSLMLNENLQQSLIKPTIVDEEAYFENTLITAILAALGLSIKDKNVNIKELIVNNTNKFLSLDIPTHKLSNKFLEFTEKFITNNNLKSHVKFVLKR